VIAVAGLVVCCCRAWRAAAACSGADAGRRVPPGASIRSSEGGAAIHGGDRRNFLRSVPFAALLVLMTVGHERPIMGVFMPCCRAP